MKLMAKINLENKGSIKDTWGVSVKLIVLLWQNNKLEFISFLVGVVIPAAIPFVTAYVFKLIIDVVVKSISSHTVDYNYLFQLFGILTVSFYIQRMAYSFQSFAQKNIFSKFPITLYSLVLGKISSLDLQYFEDSNFQNTLQNIRDSYSWRPLQQINLVFFFVQSSLQIIIALFAILKLNVFLAILITVISIPDLVNEFLFSKFSWNIWSNKTPFRKKFFYLSNLIQSGNSIKELKIFNLREKFLSEIDKNQQDFYQENRKVITQQLKVNTVFNLLDTLVSVGISGYVILEAIARRITIGDIGFYQSVIANFNNGVGGLFQNVSNMFDHSLYLKDLFDVLEIDSIIKEVNKPKMLDLSITPKIEFNNVTFKYPGTRKSILKNFSITINPGEKVAFVGENGAGKTTLIKLLARFYDVTEGEILIDGVNIKDLDLENWYRALGVLFQDFIKYEYPVKDNIYFGKVWEKEDLDKIIDAAKSAGAHEMVKKFEKEYDQMLGKVFEGGVDLSGGQWQKIALSRAFFRNAPVLILDEPTAAIDAKAESEIFNRVEKLSKDKTVIIISHRFSTVRNADKIYVIDNGKIVESGNHTQLMKLDGQYATLFNLQAKGYR